MSHVRLDLPSGTVTFAFTDVEGSTRLLHELGPEGYAEALATHRKVVRDACAANGGVEVDTQGDAFFIAFPTAAGALSAAAEMTSALASGPIRVRIGLHTGTPLLADQGYVGDDVHRAARIAAAGHGGQVLVSSSTASLVAADLTDLGEHRLKDLSAPERIYQHGAGSFPALRSLYRTNLPVPVTPFVGRRRELAEVVELLARDDVRLITLTGPGGTGKTRLSMQAAAAVGERYPAGTWWVPLAQLRDHRLVFETAARVVGSRNGLAEHIADRRMLLVFDNFEQVVEAATDLAALLTACPQLDLLATSRERLHISGEHEYAVPPLAPHEGVELFLARAREIEPDFVADGAVTEICRRLDELPLAIELAAARVKVLPAAQILARLDQRLALLTGGARDLPERQRTLRGTIEWSHELLVSGEQVLFRRLAVFRGGCALEAAEAVAGGDLDTLGSLVDKSLLRQIDGRFRMLETIREYAAERLEAAGEAEALRRRHAEHYLALAETAEPHLRLDSPVWLNRLELEHDNLRAALDHIEAFGENQLALRLGAAVARFWYLKGHLLEGQRRLEAALRADERPTAVRAQALNGAAVMALNIGNLETARLRAEQGLALNRTLGDAWGIAYSGMMVGNALGEGGDVAGAQPHLEESVRLFHELGDEHYDLIASTNLAWVTGGLGNPIRERAMHEDILRRARAIGSERMAAGALAQLAMFARDDGRLEEAGSMLREAIRLEHGHGNIIEVAINLARLASVLARAGRAPTSARLLSSSDAISEGVGASVPQWARRRNEETLTILRGRLDAAALAEAIAAGRMLTVDETVALALDSSD